MGFRHYINCLFIVLTVQLVCDCFALDLVRKSTRKPQKSHGLQKADQIFSKNPTTKCNIYKTAHTLTRHPYMRWEGGTNPKNLRMIIVSWKNIKANKTKKNTGHQRNRRHCTFSHHKPPSSTPSYIEFYYLDEIKDQNEVQNGYNNRFNRIETENGVTKSDNFKTRTRPISQSLFSFHLSDPYIRRVLVNPGTPTILKKIQKSLLYPRIETVNNSNTEKVYKRKYKVRSPEAMLNETLSYQKLVTVKNSLNGLTTLPRADPTSKEKTPLKIQIFSKMPPDTLSTFPHDRVKFFEMYDNNTLQPHEEGRHESETSHIETLSDDNNISRRNSIDDRNNHVNRRHCDSLHNIINQEHINVTKFGAKPDRLFQIRDNNASQTLPATILQNSSPALGDQGASSESESLKSGFIKVKTANWSNYPFASVYVYKPTQTHCDAAAISPHWLVVAGSCLSRHPLVHTLDERSAFVTYCGQHWLVPERVAYVKRSVVHPKFSPRDEVRRLLYNIGLIQVSSSMASCPGWSSVTLTSHEFTAEPAGSMASAVGWGLDRYGSKYTSERLPQWPLTEYHALVFCDRCPGSSTYSVARQNVGAENVYCLLLPPYVREDSDPVHGGLLLVDGQLVALYLQEERRSWGAQSAQYTGIWRLLPWVKATARESHDEDFIRS